ncbi:hypothetical protein FJ443_18250 [Mesorhizobium sp. B2-6-1]|nr:hypothetical protein FJ443_18250 [Mesorhizobium sp. B2-6-1]
MRSQRGEVKPAGQSDDQFERAVRWLAATNEPPRPLVPYLRKTFGLSAADAIRVIRRANPLRGRP